MDVGRIAAGLEQDKAQRIGTSDEDAAGEAVAVARDPMAVSIVPNVEVMR
jgi:hypothetical protein